MLNVVYGLPLEKESEKTSQFIFVCFFYGVNWGQIGRGSVLVGMTSTAQSSLGSVKLLFLYQMESSSGNVRRLPKLPSASLQSLFQN